MECLLGRVHDFYSKGKKTQNRITYFKKNVLPPYMVEGNWTHLTEGSCCWGNLWIVPEKLRPYRVRAYKYIQIHSVDSNINIRNSKILRLCRIWRSLINRYSTKHNSKNSWYNWQNWTEEKAFVRKRNKLVANSKTEKLLKPLTSSRKCL